MTEEKAQMDEERKKSYKALGMCAVLVLIGASIATCAWMWLIPIIHDTHEHFVGLFETQRLARDTSVAECADVPSDYQDCKNRVSDRVWREWRDSHEF
jgi:hypothetical protein